MDAGIDIDAHELQPATAPAIRASLIDYNGVRYHRFVGVQLEDNGDILAFGYNGCFQIKAAQPDVTDGPEAHDRDVAFFSEKSASLGRIRMYAKQIHRGFNRLNYILGVFRQKLFWI